MHFCEFNVLGNNPSILQPFRLKRTMRKALVLEASPTTHVNLSKNNTCEKYKIYCMSINIYGPNSVNTCKHSSFVLNRATVNINC